MAERARGMKLRCRNGHFEMAAFELKTQTGGYWMWVECEVDGHRGGHWLAPDTAHVGRIAVTSEPYLWPSAVAAYAARDAWEAQDDA